MKLFWHKILPLALPVLVLVAVLSSCGKNSLSAPPLSKQSKTSAITTQAQRANGALSPGELSHDSFVDKCAGINGIPKRNDTVCLAPLAEGTLDATKEGDAPVAIPGGVLKGDLITSAFSGDTQFAEIQLARHTFMNFGDSKVADISGDLSVYVKQTNGSATVATGTVKVWRCYNRNVNPDKTTNPNGLMSPVYCYGVSL